AILGRGTRALPRWFRIRNDHGRSGGRSSRGSGTGTGVSRLGFTAPPVEGRRRAGGATGEHVVGGVVQREQRRRSQIASDSDGAPGASAQLEPDQDPGRRL